jgi:hypothetical protein
MKYQPYAGVLSQHKVGGIFFLRRPYPLTPARVFRPFLQPLVAQFQSFRSMLEF